MSARDATVYDLTWPLRMLYLGPPLRPETLHSIVPLLMIPGGPAVIQYTWHGRRHVLTLPELPRAARRPPPPIKCTLVEGAETTDVSAILAPLEPTDNNPQLRAALAVLLRRPLHEGATVIEKTLRIADCLSVDTHARRL